MNFAKVDLVAPPPEPPKRASRIGARLTALAVGATVLLSLALSATQIVRDLFAEQSRGERVARQILAAAELPGSRAAFEGDNRLASEVVNGLSRYSIVGSAAIYDATGLALAESSRSEKVGLFLELLQRLFHDNRHYEIVLHAPNGQEVVGTLTLELDAVTIADGFLQRSATTLLVALALNGSLAVLLLLVFRHWLTRPLESLVSRFDSQERGDLLTAPLAMPEGHEADELGRLVETLNRYLQRLHASERELRVREERFRGIFEHAEVAIWINDFSGLHARLLEFRQRGSEDLGALLDADPALLLNLLEGVGLTQVNNATRRLFGTDSFEDFERLFHAELAPRNIAAFRALLLAIWNGENAFRAELIFRAQSGNELQTFVSIPIPTNEAGFRSVPVIVVDLSDQKKLENQLAQNQRMEAIGQLSGGIAHDFNNILGIIVGNLEIIRELYGDDDFAGERVDLALRAANRGAGLTRKILAFSRRKAAESRIVSPNEAVRDAIDLLSKSLTVSVTIETALAEDVWLIDLDVGDLQDAILNLALNARDAMGGRGRLVISTRNARIDGNGDAAEPAGLEPGDYVAVSVADEGEGMSPEVRARALEPFYSTKTGGSGSGLGLSMVYGFVLRSGGVMDIESEPGRGTTVALYFRRANEALLPSPADGPAAPSLPRGSETVLVVDDEADLAALAAFHLGELGYRVLVAGDGHEALAILRQEPDIDLLFSDVVMPGGMDGFQLAEAAHVERPEIAILLASGYARERDPAAGGGSPMIVGLARKLLAKPYDKTMLSRAVRRALADRGGRSDA
ncbi:ATP-binding protein [Oceanibacterium hippocampi]|uniref:histidine kinase n=1 Tax=Oceanibacterium hippocampi TaxID=745714 RepID=A0A1Y5SNK6_9PROT|nr:ATP-binding protein [Oceanibacterium hippocampi]SLN44458.1 Blue-light-activated protein [Oceanibacterium hippocampi]